MAGKADRHIREFVRKINRSFKLEKAILFGSRARGDNLVHSDYDLVLVSKGFQGIFFTKRMALVSLEWDEPWKLEALCYTPEEFQEKKHQIGIVSQAFKEGIAII